MDPVPGPVQAPRPEVMVDGPPGRQVVGQRPPNGAVAVDGEDRVDNLPQVDGAGTSPGLAGGSSGASTRHWPSVRSVGYRGLVILLFYRQPPFSDKL